MQVVYIEEAGTLGYIQFQYSKLEKDRRLAIYLNGQPYKDVVRYAKTTSYTLNLSEFIHLVPNQSYIIGGTIYASNLAVDAEQSCVGTLYIPETDLTKPGISINLTGNSLLCEQYVAGRSSLTASATAIGKYGASISRVEWTVGDRIIVADQISEELTNSGAMTITATAYDSRGLKNPASQTINIYDYAPPTIVPVEGSNQVVIRRADEYGQESDDGAWLRVEAANRYSALGGANSCTLQYRIKTGNNWSGWDILSTSDDTQITIKHKDGFDPKQQYIVELKLNDYAGNSYTIKRVIPTEAVYMDRAGSRNSISFGGRVTKDNAFEVNNQGYFYEGLYVGGGKNGDKGILITTPSGLKTFRIVIDDDGVISAQEVAQTFSLRKEE